jgi:hypothetical protein
VWLLNRILNRRILLLLNCINHNARRYAASDPLLQLMLGDATAAAEPKPVVAFQLPMLLDQQEMRLTAPQQTSTLLVGRSGTGKTSIAIEKLYRTAAANAHRAAALRLVGGGGGGGGGDGGAGGNDLAPHVNVLFVCRSRTLCSQVQRHFLELLVPLGEPAVAQAELQAAFLEGRDLSVPLFLSSAEWLVLLDRAAPKRFFGSQREEAEFISLLNGGDCLAALLPPDEDEPDQPPSSSSSAGAAADAATGRRRVKERRQATAKLPPRRHLLTYQRFLPLLEGLRERGAHGVSKEARALPASTIYREFYSFIRGSAGAMTSVDGQLSRTAYCALATKMTAVGVEQRELIYDLYEQFACRKRKLHLFDTMDVLHHLHAQQRKRVSAEQPRHTPLHRLLIDECQDLTQAELSLPNPNPNPDPDPDPDPNPNPDPDPNPNPNLNPNPDAGGALVAARGGGREERGLLVRRHRSDHLARRRLQVCRCAHPLPRALRARRGGDACSVQPRHQLPHACWHR